MFLNLCLTNTAHVAKTEIKKMIKTKHYLPHFKLH